jgi:hypothetical protein
MKGLAMRLEHYYRWSLPMTMLAMGPSVSKIDVTDGNLTVTMGWGFRMRAPVAEVESIRREEKPIPWTFGIGVHGWAREWAVNASRRNHVVIAFKSPQRARVIGFPVRVSTLHLSVARPEELISALAAA